MTTLTSVAGVSVEPTARGMGRFAVRVLVLGSAVWAFHLTAFVGMRAAPVTWDAVAKFLISDVLSAFALLLAVTIADNVAGSATERRAPYFLAVVAGAALGAMLQGLAMQLIWNQFVWEWGPIEWSIVERRVVHFRIGLVFYAFFEWLLIGAAVTFIHTDRRRSKRAADRLHAAEIERSRTAKRMLESKLQAMQARVEPAFLFNTLAQIRALYERDPALAERTLEELIAYLRAAMPKMRDTSSTVAQEVELVRAYLEIVKLRLGERLSFEIDIPADAGSARMPPMMMLPLADHAVVYGLEKRQGDGAITISVDVAAGRLRLVVIDRGAGFVPEAQGDGIASIRERLAALYGPNASLDLRRGDVDGTAAILEIPYETGRDEAAP